MLILSYSMGNSNGKSMCPSSIISKIQKYSKEIERNGYFQRYIMKLMMFLNLKDKCIPKILLLIVSV